MSNRTYGKQAGTITRIVLDPCKSDEHKKVNQTGTIGTGYKWICSECGTTGFDPFKPKQTEYDKLVEKFHG